MGTNHTTDALAHAAQSAGISISLTEAEAKLLCLALARASGCISGLRDALGDSDLGQFGSALDEFRTLLVQKLATAGATDSLTTFAVRA